MPGAVVRPRRRGRAVLTLVLVLAVGAAVLLLAWGGPPRFVVTGGTSMEPTFSTGDLAVLRPVPSYRPGDVAAYRSTSLRGTVVLHRVRGVGADGRYELQGDANDWVDTDRPSDREMVGRLLLRVPGGGEVLGRLLDPSALGVGAFLLAGGGAAATTRHRRRRRRSTVDHPGAGDGQRPPGEGLLSALARGPGRPVPASWRVVGGWAAACALAGVLLGLAAGSSPAQVLSRVEPGAVSFSYSADVVPSVAYEGRTAWSPDPVFRTLARRVDVHLAYRGGAETFAVAAELSAPNGWRDLAPLVDPQPVRGGVHEVSVGLDLPMLDRRLRQVSRATGLPVETLRIDVVGTATGAGGTTWQPRLALELTPHVLRLVGEPGTLVAGEPGPAPVVGTGERVLGLPLTAGAARRLALLMVLLGLAVLGGVGLRLRSLAAAPEGAALRQAWGALLLPVDPVPLPAGRPVVDLADPRSLARLADRYGLLVLHWRDEAGEVFVVQDEAATYRYRAPAGSRDGTEAPLPSAPGADVPAPRRGASPDGASTSGVPGGPPTGTGRRRAAR